MQFKLLTLLLLVGTTLAVPIEQRSPSTECRRNCPVSPLQKLSFQQGKTYLYQLQSQQHVKVDGISQQEAQLQWSADVQLTYETPCQVSLRVLNPRLQGQAPSSSFVTDMTAHPIRAVVTDGVVQQVCVSDEDSTQAINVKKGILSTLQNTLPSNSSIHDGLKVKETDIVGICETVYRVKNEGNKVMVEKSKDHRLCSERYPYPSLTSLSAMYLKSPLIFKTSKSKCVQEIENGVIKTTSCVDKNVLTPMPGVKKSAVTEQKSTLTLKSVLSTSSHAEIPQLRRTNLLYDFSLSQGNESAVPEMEAKMAKLSESISNSQRTNKSAELFSELVHLMNKVPESAIETGLQKAKELQNFTSLYLDAVAATSNPGAVKVMVDEIVAGRHMFEFTLSLFQFPRPCRHAVSAVKPLIERDLPAPVKLAAGSIVGKYCRTESTRRHEKCEQIQEVREVMQVIASKLSSTCKQSKQQESARRQAITLLKVAGNIRRMSQELQTSILSCLEESDVAEGVQVAAADALRAMPCKHKVVKQLLTVARDTRKQTDVRIFAYKAGIQCANSSDISHLLNVVTTDHNQHVRSYILSDLTNLQATTSPKKVEIRRKLASFNISQDYHWNPMNNSLNYEFSRFTQSEIFGSELTFDIVHDLTAMLPIDMRTNLTLDLFRQFTNVAEMGIRIENVPAIIKKLFREGSHIGDSPVGRVVRSMVDHLPRAGETGNLDAFLKILGREVMYTSLTTKENYERDILYEILKKVSDVYNKMKAGITVQSVRGFQSRYVMHVPTIQGIPLIVMRDLSLVVNMQAKPANEQQTIELAPTVSMMTKFFVGYKFGPSVGIKSKNSITSSSDVKVSLKINEKGVTTKIDMPQQALELIQAKSETYMCVQKPGQPEEKVKPSSKNTKISDQQCKSYDSFGVQMCYHYSATNVWQENDFPFVEPMHAKLVFKKTNPSTQGFEISLAQKQLAPKIFEMKLAVPGHSNPVKLAVDALVDVEWPRLRLALVTKLEEKTYGFRLQTSPGRSDAVYGMTYELFTGLKSITDQGEQAIISKISVDEERASLVFKTSGPLEKNFRADIDVEGQYSESTRKLECVIWKKCEVMMAYKNYQSEIYFRDTPGSQESQRYDAKLALKSGQSTLFEISGLSQIKKMSSGFEAETDMKCVVRDTEWTVKSIWKKMPGDHRFSAEVMKGKSEKLVSLVAECKGMGEANKVLALLQVPSRDIKMKLTSSFDASKNLILSMQKNDREVLSVRGPLTVEWTRSEKKIEGQLGVRLPSKELSYHLDTKIEMSPRTHLIKMIVNKGGQVIMDFFYDYTNTSSALTFESKIKQKRNWDTQVKIVTSSERVEMSVDAKMPVITEREVRGTVSAQMNGPRKGHFSSRLRYDAQRDPKKTIAASGSFNAEDPHHVSLEGEAETSHGKYQYDISTYWKADGRRNFEKIVAFNIRKDSSQYIELRSNIKYSKQQSQLQISSFQQLKTPSHKVYELRNTIEGAYESNWLKYKVDSMVETPEFGKLELSTEWTPSPSSSSISTQVSISRTPRQQQQQPERLAAEGKFQTSPQTGTIQQGQIKIEIEAAGKKYAVDMSEDSRSGDTLIAMKKNDRVQFEVQSKRSGSASNNRIEVEVSTPHRKTHISGKYNPEEQSFRVVPDASQQHKKYEMSFSNEQTRHGKKKSVSVEFHHNQRQKHVSGEWQQGQQGMQSKLELDVMSHQGKIVTIKVTGNSIDTGISQYKVETFSSGGTQGPVLIVDARNTTSEKSIRVSYKKTSVARPSLHVAVKSVRQTHKDRVVSVIIQNEDRKVLEVGGVMSYVHNYGCQGIRLNTTAKIDSLPPYLLEVQGCGPAFLKVVVSKKESNDRFVAKLGLRGRLHAEASLIHNTRQQASPSWKQLSGLSTEHAEQPLFALSAKLLKPTTLALRAQFNKENLQRTMEETKQEYNRESHQVGSIFSEICSKICNDMQEKIPEMRQLVESMKEFVRTVRESNYLQRISEKVSQMMRYVSQVAESVNRVLTKINREVEAVFDDLLSQRDTLKQRFLNAAEKVTHKLKQWMRLSDESLDISKILEQISKWCSEQVDQWMDEYCPPYCPCKDIQVMFHSFVHQLKIDLKSAAKLVLQDPSTQYEKSMLRHYLNMLDRRQYLQLAENVIVLLTPKNAGILTQKSGIQVNLPLSQPLGSILSAPRFIGFRSQVTYFRTFGVGKITNINRQTLVLPKSKCEYFLTETHTTSLTFANLTQPDHCMTLTHGEHVIKIMVQQRQLFIDGRLETRTNFETRLSPTLFAMRRDNAVLVLTPALSSEFGMREMNSATTLQQKGRGIVWQDYPSPNDPQELEKQWAKFKVNPNCQ